MEYLKINNLKLEYKNEELLRISSLNIQEGQRIGLIGNNGAGKTTLLKALNDEPVVFDITGQVKRNCQIVSVPQILDYDEESGGEKEKSAIVEAVNRLQHCRTGLLFLDEPTSNLDIDQQSWLVELVNNLAQPVLIISHDRHFLEQTVNTVWLLQDKKVSQFSGTYVQFCEAMKKEREKQTVTYYNQKKHVEKLKKAQRQKEEKGKRATKKKKNISWSDWKITDSGKIQKRLMRSSTILKDRVEKETAKLKKPVVRHSITLNNIQFDNLELPKNTTLLRIEPQKIVVVQKRLFRVSDQLKIKNGMKIALVGPNGSGKSVFLSQLATQKVNEWVNPKVKIGFFRQNMTREITSSKTVQAEIQRLSIFDNTATMQLLGDLHLRPFLQTEIRNLSGGQLICFKLAKVLLGQHNLLILDEPTNFLDLSAIMALEEFLKNYPFAVIVVSHDQEFLDNLNFTTWKIQKQQLVLPTTFVSKKNAQQDNQLELLKFKLDQLMARSDASMDEIQKISRKIMTISRGL